MAQSFAAPLEKRADHHISLLIGASLSAAERITFQTIGPKRLVYPFSSMLMPKPTSQSKSIFLSYSAILMNESDDTTRASQAPAREQRSTRFTGIYSNSTKIEDIIDKTCTTDVSEVVHENACISGQYLRTLDVTIVDVLRNDLYHETREGVHKKNRQWFQEKGAVE